MTPDERAFLAAARTATLATIGPGGRPRLVPVCFVVAVAFDHLFTPLDEKPKSVADPRALARVRDIERRPDVTLLVDRWDEDWSRLAWCRVEGHANIVEPPSHEHRAALELLRAKYRQYATHDLEARPLIRIRIERVRSWGDLSDRGTAPAPPAGDSGSSSSPGGSPRH